MMWGYYYPGMGWFAILVTLFWLILIGLAVWAILRWVLHQTRTGAPPIGGPTPTLSAEEILRQRFARGEIDAATFQTMREQLASGGGRPPTS